MWKFEDFKMIFKFSKSSNFQIELWLEFMYMCRFANKPVTTVTSISRLR